MSFSWCQVYFEANVPWISVINVDFSHFKKKKIVECSESGDFFRVQSKVQIKIYARDLIIELKYENMYEA